MNPFDITIPKEVVGLKHLTPNEKIVYGMLRKLEKRKFLPTNQELADLLGLHFVTIVIILTKLKKKGFVEIISMGKQRVCKITPLETM